MNNNWTLISVSIVYGGPALLVYAFFTVNDFSGGNVDTPVKILAAGGLMMWVCGMLAYAYLRKIINKQRDAIVQLQQLNGSKETV